MVEVILRNRVEPVVGSHPELIRVILDDAIDHVAEEPLLHGEGVHPLLADPDQPAAVGSGPNHPIRRLMQRDDHVCCQAIIRVDHADLVIADVGQAPIIGPRPDRPVRRAKDRHHETTRKSVVDRGVRKGLPIEIAEASVCPNPQVALRR